jgi:hypothetical protein
LARPPRYGARAINLPLRPAETDNQQALDSDVQPQHKPDHQTTEGYPTVPAIESKAVIIQAVLDWKDSRGNELPLSIKDAKSFGQSIFDALVKSGHLPAEPQPEEPSYQSN